MCWLNPKSINLYIMGQPLMKKNWKIMEIFAMKKCEEIVMYMQKAR
jgi:hypothetical protein